MLLFLMRHGPAEPGRPGQADEARSLTEAGREQTRRQAAAMAEGGLVPSSILTSPYQRARQTAELLAASAGAPVTVEPALGCGCTLEGYAAAVGGAGLPERLLTVGHQPDVGAILYALTGTRARVTPGTVAVVEVRRVRPDGGTLVGLYNPQTLAALMP